MLPSFAVAIYVPAAHSRPLVQQPPKARCFGGTSVLSETHRSVHEGLGCGARRRSVEGSSSCLVAWCPRAVQRERECKATTGWKCGRGGAAVRASVGVVRLGWSLPR